METAGSSQDTSTDLSPADLLVANSTQNLPTNFNLNRLPGTVGKPFNIN